MFSKTLKIMQRLAKENKTNLLTYFMDKITTFLYILEEISVSVACDSSLPVHLHIVIYKLQ